MKLSQDQLKTLIKFACMAAKEEIGCDECFDQLHEFADLKLQGKSPEEAMPLVKDHLKLCFECRQEYEALLEALKRLQ